MSWRARIADCRLEKGFRDLRKRRGVYKAKIFDIYMWCRGSRVNKWIEWGTRVKSEESEVQAFPNFLRLGNVCGVDVGRSAKPFTD